MKKLVNGVVALAALVGAGLAQAGPVVHVTFKNLGSKPAELKLVTSNENSTFLIANPKPRAEVPPGENSQFNVQRLVSPDVNGAQVRYVIGAKTCAFSSTFLLHTLPGGINQPKWIKSATPSGGATCTATITRMNADYSWDVEFTMK